MQNKLPFPDDPAGSFFSQRIDRQAATHVAFASNHRPSMQQWQSIVQAMAKRKENEESTLLFLI
jgi:hypothetical protein